MSDAGGDTTTTTDPNAAQTNPPKDGNVGSVVPDEPEKPEVARRAVEDVRTLLGMTKEEFETALKTPLPENGELNEVQDGDKDTAPAEVQDGDKDKAPAKENATTTETENQADSEKDADKGAAEGGRRRSRRKHAKKSKKTKKTKKASKRRRTRRASRKSSHRRSRNQKQH